MPKGKIRGFVMDISEVIKPFRFGEIRLWHLPVPEYKKNIGERPSQLAGVGTDILKVRALDPGEDRAFYSPHHSAEFGIPMGVFFRRQEDVRIVILVDLPSAFDFKSRGDISKKEMAVKVASTFGNTALQKPNEGTAALCAAAASYQEEEPCSSPVYFRSCLRRLVTARLRVSRSTALSSALRRCSEGRTEELIIVISDFLFRDGDAEWSNLASVCQGSFLSGNEVVFIRVLDEFECMVKSVASFSVRSGQGGTVWTSLGTRSRLNSRHKDMRERLSEIVENPEVRLLEIVIQEGDIGGLIKTFLRKRARYIEQKLSKLLV